MNLRRVAVVLTTLGAVAATGATSASAATAAPARNHHDWCFAQHWHAGDSHWRQCDDVAGWWNRDRHDDHHENNWQSGHDHRR